ncbi:hypothetical protein MRY82_06825 [bacterium]|nr:hypothetical protein [bacterium]
MLSHYIQQGFKYYLTWFKHIVSFFVHYQNNFAVQFSHRSHADNASLYILTSTLFLIAQLTHSAYWPLSFVLLSSIAFAIYLPVFLVITALISQAIINYFKLEPKLDLTLTWQSWLNFYLFWLPLLGLNIFLSQIHFLLSPCFILVFLFVLYRLFLHVLGINQHLSRKIIFYAGIVPLGLILLNLLLKHWLFMSRYQSINTLLNTMY